jgi:hydroxymethylglutaryl-CoA synthase
VKDVGIIAVEIYFPNTYVDQSDLEVFDKAPKGKYTIGLGQLKMACVNDREDVNSISLTCVNNLMKKHNIDPRSIGRLEVGTETLLDKSKSVKTTLMELFRESGNHDIEGVTTINACYGGTNAVFSTINWVQSNAYDGRYGIVLCTDVAVYPKGNARPTGGCGAVAMLIGPNASLVFEDVRSTFIDNNYDFYKPNPFSEYPTVDGHLSINVYLNALAQCYETFKQKYHRRYPGVKPLNYHDFDYFCFHTPFAKMV